jgi:hypothetical protein
LVADGYFLGHIGYLTPMMAAVPPRPPRRSAMFGGAATVAMLLGGSLQIALHKITFAELLPDAAIVGLIVGLLHRYLFRPSFVVGEHLAEALLWFDGVTPAQHPIRPIVTSYGITIFCFSLLIFLVGSFDGAFSGPVQPLPYLDCLYLSATTITTAQANVNATSRLAQLVLSAESVVGVIWAAVFVAEIASIRQRGGAARART